MSERKGGECVCVRACVREWLKTCEAFVSVCVRKVCQKSQGFAMTKNDRDHIALEKNKRTCASACVEEREREISLEEKERESEKREREREREREKVHVRGTFS